MLQVLVRILHLCVGRGGFRALDDSNSDSDSGDSGAGGLDSGDSGGGSSSADSGNDGDSSTSGNQPRRRSAMRGQPDDLSDPGALSPDDYRDIPLG